MSDHLIYLLPVATCAGALGYAIRGGQWLKLGSTQLGRLFFVLPMTLLASCFTFGGYSPILTGLEINGWQYDIMLQLAHGLYLMFLVLLGHGVFMDMGRWLPLKANNYRKAYGSIPSGKFIEHEKPITWLIGPEDYGHPFWRRWLHNAVGMALLGIWRHSHAWIFCGTIDAFYLTLYTLTGAIHPFLYEVGYWTATKISNDEQKKIHHAEYMTGAVWMGGFFVLLTTI